MPSRAPRPCAYPGCTHYAAKRGRCEDHQPTPWADKVGKSSTQLGYGSKWQRLRKIILKRDGYLCQTCKRNGITTRGTQVDHIYNKAAGGTDDPSNLETICSACHKTKTSQEASEARRRAQSIGSTNAQG